MEDVTCSVDGCAKRAHTRGWCQAHYFRVRRNGTTGTSKIRVLGAPKPECSVDGCSSLVSWIGMCDKHAQRMHNYGDPEWVTPKWGVYNGFWHGDDIGIRGAHDRVKNRYGPAKKYACCNCGKAAAHWAYDHADPDEKLSPLGAFSTNPDHYQPMCVPCHKRFDLDHIQEVRNGMARPQNHQ